MTSPAVASQYGQCVDCLHHVESWVTQDHFPGEDGAARVIYLLRGARTAVMQCDDPVFGHERAPAGPIGPQAFVAVISVDEHEIRGRLAGCRALRGGRRACS